MVNVPGLIGVAVLFGLLFLLRLGRFRRIHGRRNTTARRTRTPLARRLGRVIARRRR